jgi:hypothetical protein
MGATVSEQPVGMRLNQIPLDPGGGSGATGVPGCRPDLASSPAEKKAAANALENSIEPGTRAAGKWADAETGTTVSAFRDGWLTSAALKKAHTAWDHQVTNLMNRLASEKSALRATNTLLQNTDITIGGDTRSVSVLDGY